MKNKWIEKEAYKWMVQGIISDDQRRQIVNRYAGPKYGIGILPILAGLLIGLSVLSFIAANWQAISPLIRLLLIIVLTSGMYVAGEKLQQRGQNWLGEGLVGAGLLIFGAGLFLLVQTYHLMFYNAALFIVWGLAGLALTYLYASRFLGMLSFGILMSAQIYSLQEYHSFSYIALLVLLAGLSWFVYKQKSLSFSLLFVAGLFIQFVMLLDELNVSHLWSFIVLALFYLLQNALAAKTHQLALRIFSLSAAYGYAIWIAFIFGPEMSGFSEPHIYPYVYLPLWVILFALHFVLRMRTGETVLMLEWMLFLPLFLLPAFVDYAYLLNLLCFSVYLLFYGYHIQSKLVIRLATISFVVMTLIAYTRLTWAFMDKSIFFLTAGLLMAGLSMLLHRKNKKMLDGEGNQNES